MNGIIKDAKLKMINKVWKKHKPQGLGFSDNDAIVITVKMDDGKEFSQSFYCRLKGDGTVGDSMTHASEKRQKELQEFIKKYISEDYRKYNVKEGIESWKLKLVEVEKKNDKFTIKL